MYIAIFETFAAQIYLLALMNFLNLLEEFPCNFRILVLPTSSHDGKRLLAPFSHLLLVDNLTIYNNHVQHIN